MLCYIMYLNYGYLSKAAVNSYEVGYLTLWHREISHTSYAPCVLSSKSLSYKAKQFVASDHIKRSYYDGAKGDVLESCSWGLKLSSFFHGTLSALHLGY